MARALAPAKERTNPSPDWAGLELYDDPPIQGLISRISYGLRVRDRVLSGMLALEGNESHQVVLYETGSLMLQLSSALDLLAKIVNRLFGINIKKYDVGWTKTKFRDELHKAWSELSDEVLSLVTTTAQLLGLIRNRIHAGPPAPVAGDDTVWFALASEDQATFELRARDVGGAAAWGIVEDRGSRGGWSTMDAGGASHAGFPSRPTHSSQAQLRAIAKYDSPDTGLALGLRDR